MTNESYIIMFIKKIIEDGDLKNKETIKKLVIEFKNYLIATKAINQEQIANILKIIDCLDEILIVKEKTGQTIDIEAIFNKEKEIKKLAKQKTIAQPSSTYDDSHYNHYHSYSSSGCGSIGGSSSC